MSNTGCPPAKLVVYPRLISALTFLILFSKSAFAMEGEDRPFGPRERACETANFIRKVWESHVINISPPPRGPLVKPHTSEEKKEESEE